MINHLSFLRTSKINVSLDFFFWDKKIKKKVFIIVSLSNWKALFVNLITQSKRNLGIKLIAL